MLTKSHIYQVGYVVELTDEALVLVQVLVVCSHSHSAQFQCCPVPPPCCQGALSH